MKKTLCVAILAAAAFACGGSKKSASEPAVAAAPADPVPAEPTAPVAGNAGADASCAQLIDHFIEVMLTSDEYKNAKDEEKKMVEDMLPQIKEQGLAQCENENPPPESRACIMASNTMEALEACDKKE